LPCLDISLASAALIMKIYVHLEICCRRIYNNLIHIQYNEVIILPVVLYGCETWYLTLREGHRLKVFENMIKVKVNLSLCLTKHHTMKLYWGWRYNSMHSLASALYIGEWSASCPSCFTPRERAPVPTG